MFVMVGTDSRRCAVELGPGLRPARAVSQQSRRSRQHPSRQGSPDWFRWRHTHCQRGPVYERSQRAALQPHREQGGHPLRWCYWNTPDL